MFSKTEMRAFSVDLCSSALTSTELNIIIIPGVSQGYTLLAHFCMCALCSINQLLYTKKGVQIQEKDTGKEETGRGRHFFFF